MNGPDYIIAGASKSGTTWVAHCLKEHPEVCIPLKELNFFSHNFEKGWNWYIDQFNCNREGVVLVEKSPSYMANMKVPGRVKSVDKDIKVIFIIRDPVRRAYSDYCMKYKRGEATEKINTEIKKRRDIIENGMYYNYISRYIKTLGKENVNIMLFDDLKKDDKKFIEKIQKKIGLKKIINPTLIGNKVNKSKSRPVFKSLDKIKIEVLNKMQGLSPSIDQVIKWAVNGWPSAVYNKLNRSKNEPPRMKSEIKETMADIYRHDVRRMSELISKDLEDLWLSKYER
jgi:hypothetical protein